MKWTTDKKKLLQEINTEKKFEKWKKKWFEEVPQCKDFQCVHELMSCGISYICGCSSIFRTFEGGLWYAICQDVNCIDCVLRYKCKRTNESKMHPRRVR